MVIAILIVLGLALGSFVNALVWRLRQQSLPSNKSRVAMDKYSVLKGRSMCPNCHHELAAKDLVPLFSWLTLQGNCRYCHKPISIQYPLVETVTALLFVGSYVFWPVGLSGSQVAVFALWLVLLVGLMALLVYDLRWMLLPNRVIFPLLLVAGAQALVKIVGSSDPGRTLADVLLAAVLGGGIFYILFQVSNAKWIGGGDVKLGLLLGSIVAAPAKSILVIFLASVFGTLVSLPLLFSQRLGGKSMIPFGPFLIVAAIVVVLFGDGMIEWYRHSILLLG